MSKPKTAAPAIDPRAGAQRSTLVTTPAPSPEAPQPATAKSHHAATTEEKE